MGRGKRWCDQEDEALARAYKAAAENPIRGTDQKATAFWEDVWQRTATAFAGDSRTLQAIKNRWSIISHDTANCRKFAVFRLPACQNRSRDAVTESEKEASEPPQGRDQAKKARVLNSAAESTSSLLQQLIIHNTEKHERVLAELTRKNELRDEELAICLFETTPN
ncbi:hypothetical protein DVH05_006796 [Phytophthora capsici]|nr:hypothetical protein DVH05_006796 [Phytophthora capsici]|eukprot:jgi/Phyca11/5941/fgenesh1_pm.PHYCAscaffold_9_\